MTLQLTGWEYTNGENFVDLGTYATALCCLLAENGTGLDLPNTFEQIALRYRGVPFATRNVITARAKDL